MSGLFINIATNPASVASVFKFRKNGANGNQTMTIGAGLTGIFQDTTHTDTVAVGDLVCAEYIPTSSATTAACGATFASSVPSTNDVTSGAATGARLQGDGTLILSLMNTGPFINTVPSNRRGQQIAHGFGVTTSNFGINISSNSGNTLNGAVTFTLCRNNTTVTQSVAVGAGLTGWFYDSSNTDVYAPGDTLDIQYNSLATSGSAVVIGTSLTETQNMPTVGAAAGAGSTSGSGVTGFLGAGLAAAASSASATGIAAAILAGGATALATVAATGIAAGIGAGSASSLASAAAVGLMGAVGAGLVVGAAVAAGVGVPAAAGIAAAAANAIGVGASIAATVGAVAGGAIAGGAGSALGWLRLAANATTWAPRSGVDGDWSNQPPTTETWTEQSANPPIAP